jgi:hypothetical protein
MTTTQRMHGTLSHTASSCWCKHVIPTVALLLLFDYAAGAGQQPIQAPDVTTIRHRQLLSHTEANKPTGWSVTLT